MHNNSQTKVIQVSQLLLDPENPRLASVQNNNHDAIRAMTKVQGEKVIALAEHLIENGPNPANLMIVIPTKTDEKLFYVLDGNRRLTALKLLESPLLADGILKTSILQVLKKLAERFEVAPIKQINCSVFSNRHDADLWIQLTHRGLNKGAGMLAWDGQVGARYDERRKGQKDIALQLLDFTQKYGSLSQSTLEKIENGKFPITTLNRVLGTPYVRKKLGMDKTQKEVMFLFPKEEVAKGLSRVIEDLASSEVTVSDLKNQEQRIDYINNLETAELPQEDLKLPKPEALRELVPTIFPFKNIDEQDDVRDQTGKSQSESSDQTRSANIAQPRSPRTPFPQRSTLIPRTFKVTITQKRINDLCKELKRLNIKEYSNAGAIMLRVFIELSTDYFVEKQLGWSEQKIGNSQLKNKLGAVTNFMKENDVMTANELATIQKVIAGDGMPAASVKSMNQYVHNRYYSPVASELIVVWDDFQGLIQNIWNVVE